MVRHDVVDFNGEAPSFPLRTKPHWDDYASKDSSTHWPSLMLSNLAIPDAKILLMDVKSPFLPASSWLVNLEYVSQASTTTSKS